MIRWTLKPAFCLWFCDAHRPASSHLSLRCSEPGHDQQSGRISCAPSLGRQLWSFLTNEVTHQPKQMLLCLQAALLSDMGATPSSCISLITLPRASFSRRFTYLLCPWLAHAFQSLTSLTNSSVPPLRRTLSQPYSNPLQD